ncbi:16S rRNA (guanine(966)-N(2))-methyltransferase RsmD [bacterium]|nr:16S rRNA (guanine(966)-N(2))-methyltransferase RsmD [bacterium]
MRIISGQWKGHALHVPSSAAFRPTTDRVKESLFNILAGLVDWPGTAVCDLYAGSGGLGLEALSRGAAEATFVEHSASSLAVLRRNISALGADQQCRVQKRDVIRFCRNSEHRYPLVFADPPYAEFSAEELMNGLASVLQPRGIAVLEHGGRIPLPESDQLSVQDERVYGSTIITIYQSHSGEAV